jgi:hypothetical protein
MRLLIAWELRIPLEDLPGRVHENETGSEGRVDLVDDPWGGLSWPDRETMRAYSTRRRLKR